MVCFFATEVRELKGAAERTQQGHGTHGDSCAADECLGKIGQLPQSVL